MARFVNGALMALLLLCTAHFTRFAEGRKLRSGASTRVFNGAEVTPETSAQLGFLVALYVTPTTKEEAATMTPFCTGSLIASNVVLSAAHCFVNASGHFYSDHASNFSVVIEGEKDRFTPLSSIVVHSGYVHATTVDPSTRGIAPYDVAVLKLSVDSSVAPVGVLDSGSLLAADHEMMVAGYGDVDQTDNMTTLTTNTLRWAHVKNYLSSDCPGGVHIEGHVHVEGTLCAGGSSSICQGDSGGPLLVKDPANPSRPMLVGITSYTWPCGAQAAVGLEEYSYFTDARVFRNDIFEMIDML